MSAYRLGQNENRQRRTQRCMQPKVSDAKLPDRFKSQLAVFLILALKVSTGFLLRTPR